MKSTVLIAIAVGCGLIAMIGVLQYMRQLPKSQAVQLEPVVVAIKEIDINTPFSDENLKLVQWPGNQVPPGAAKSLKDLENKYARIRLFPGEAILPGKVMESDDTSGSVRVPQGYRVVSVKSDAQTAVSNLVEPGDRVDVIVVLGAKARAVAVAKTILLAVRVFAINREMSRNPDGTVAPDGARTVSLLVKPDQAEKLMMASELGEIRLALRGPDDPRVDETGGCTVRDMLGMGDVADEQSAGLLANVTPRGPNFASLGGSASPANPAALDLLGLNDPSSAGWTMVLSTPDESRTFTWADKNGQPEEQSCVRGLPPAPSQDPEPTAPAEPTEPLESAPEPAAPEPATPAEPLDLARSHLSMAP